MFSQLAGSGAPRGDTGYGDACAVVLVEPLAARLGRLLLWTLALAAAVVVLWFAAGVLMAPAATAAPVCPCPTQSQPGQDVWIEAERLVVGRRWLQRSEHGPGRLVG